uniref:Momilactone A synthase n=1 Tax=Anthurium amnicola TaxID=1678845 RepID=A0A1D1Y693_9ARAE
MVGGGSVINVGSAGSVVGGVATHAYVASKHGLVGLTRRTAAELGRHGVRVNCLSPFVCASELASAFLDKGAPAVEAWIAGMATSRGWCSRPTTSRRRRCSSPATSPATSAATTSSSTAASPPSDMPSGSSTTPPPPPLKGSLVYESFIRNCRQQATRTANVQYL